MEVFLEGYEVYKEVRIIMITQISPDTKLFRFGFPSDRCVLGLTVGQHIRIKARVISPACPLGAQIKRKYSPTSRHDALGFFEIPIKIYHATDEYPGGALTSYLNTLSVNDIIQISGPCGKYIYLGNGNCKFYNSPEPKHFEALGFIAGGTGITPCFQYIQYIIEKGEDISLHLIFANKTEKDILLREDLEKFEATGKLHLYYTVSTSEANWRYATGYVNEEMILEHMPKPSDSVGIFFCGPSPMNRMLRELLPRIGYLNSTKF